MLSYKIKYTLIVSSMIFLTGCPGGSTSNDFNYGPVGDFAIPCAASSQCESGRCIEMNDGTGCSQYCYDAGDCPENFYCAPEESDSEELRGLCRPIDPNSVCHSCSSDTQCEIIGGLCRGVGQGNFCVMDCSVDDCPQGFTCTPQPSGEQICVPDTNDCSCNIFKEGAMRSCQNSNDFGTCTGTIECRGELGWSNCNGQIPGPEICDGEDNNCDGNIDEGLLGTKDHCSQCYDICQGSGISGTEPVCVEGECDVSCYENYYDANINTQDGCECIDDTQGAESATAAISMGNFSSCDFSHQLATAKVPADINNKGHADYYKFNYNNPWNCQENLQVELRVYSPAPQHRLCVSSANNTTESSWSCQTATAGNTVNIKPYNNDGAYYLKVELVNEGEVNCTPYQLTIKDN
ncbi:hypothetical protein KKF34_07005 [Myxococcota bacterium]|nr:hypothetical protein [Myxococcota bacterium]MBU1379187.1 hypothetical protein [Myxococcota bacterium]MBU1496610.1 hypothetical protein [Myxococcota bacterium]